MTRYCNYGFLISLLVHMLILAIPFSIIVNNHFKEVELFVLEEKPKQPMEEKKPKPTKPPKQQIIQPQPSIVQPEPQVVEPAIITTKHEAPVLMPPSKPITEPPKVVAPATKPLLDVEFGSPNAPTFIHREMPVYPLIARRIGKEGRVLLRLTIDEKGKLLNVEVLEDAGYGFSEAAVEAVKKSTFSPAMRDGKPVLSKALLPIRFSLRRD
ncbi:MAG: energy transducer TonB [Thermodesulfovibrionales bacterium]|nr:energy transducer TonB [Thermodesulfovibrionales bacterium]